MAFSYQGDTLKKRVEPLAQSIGVTELIECDVADAGSLDRLFDHLQKVWGKLDFVVHAIGFSDKGELRGRYVDTGPENFRMTMDISVYSFTAVCKRAAAMMPDGGSLLERPTQRGNLRRGLHPVAGYVQHLQLGPGAAQQADQAACQRGLVVGHQGSGWLHVAAPFQGRLRLARVPGLGSCRVSAAAPP